MPELQPISYMEKGDGQPVVLIHGFCENKELWKDFQEKLSSQFRVICPDLPGFGDSPLPPGDLSMEYLAKGIGDWMFTMNIMAPVVVGHSLGGYVALALAELMDGQIKGLGLFHSTAFADDEDKIGIRNRTITFLEKNGAEPFIRTFVPGLFPEKTRKNFYPIIDEIIEMGIKTPPEVLIAYTKAMRDRKDRMEVLSRFQSPKFMIAGEMDSAVNILSSRKHREAVDDYFELKDTGHMGMFERKKETLEFLETFLMKVKS